MSDSERLELLLLLEELERRRAVDSARTSLLEFAAHASRGHWQSARHLELLAETLEKVAVGDILRLIIELPPRHGKSELSSVYFPTWFLGNNPDKTLILSCYAAELAESFGRRVRNSLEEIGPELWGITVASDSAARGRWNIEGHRGGMYAVGVGGTITGRGADVLIIDDPIKNVEEASSQAYRDSQWQWWQTTARTRLEPNGAAIVIMTRWHEDDLVGRLLKEAEAGGEQWHRIRLPALAEEGDPLGRRPGEALWPGRYDEATLRQTRTAVGSRAWSALYQQRPTPDEGGLFKRGWWRHYREVPGQFDEVIQSWDMTFKDTSSSDFVVGQVWGIKGAEKYLLDQVRDRMDFPTTVQAVRTMSGKWPQALAKLVEDKANGPAVISTLRREIPGLIAVEPQGSKVARANAVSPTVEAGNVYLPDPAIAAWVHDFIEECTSFPNGANDDQVDAMTQALLRLADVRGPITSQTII